MELKPLSKKQMYSILASTKRLNIWDGSVRSGKTISSIIRWIEYLKSGPPGNLLMVGKTHRTLKRNILDVIQDLVGEENYRFNRGMGEVEICGRKIYVAGANDERAQDKIRGMTLAGAYGDELSIWPESNFKMLLSRLSVKDAKLFGTTNPEGPYHWLKTEYLDREGELNLKRFRFKLEDNTTLDPMYIENLKKEYSGVWYQRYIEGEWAIAEGVVYDMFDHEKHVVDTIPRILQYWVGVDYGTSNATTFILSGLGEDGKLYIIDEYYHSGSETGQQKWPSKYSQEFQTWLKQQRVKPQKIFVDPSAEGFILQLWSDGVKNIVQADNAVKRGIELVSSIIGNDMLRVHRRCKHTLREFSSYVWDPKAQERGEDRPLKQSDHCMDPIRYIANGTRGIWIKRGVISAKLAS